jgi:Spy/CpxP family protein refolding chaperone
LKVLNTQFVFQLVLLAMAVSAFAQHAHQVGSGSLPEPGTCPAGATCKTGTGTTDARPSSVPGPDSGDTSDPSQQGIWSVAQQLHLTSDQRAELKSSLKGDSDEGTEINKAVQDARSALANALANGQNLLDSEIEGLASANAKAQEHELKFWAKLYAVLTPDQQRQSARMSTPLSWAAVSHGITQAQ